ncbi:hypothetical protein T484DRAFT_1801762 [Baffinella frigidus]|nr:hypothetical protein T484DRAFT_1801762 [Cryptophyta sp. CCMP2293]
MAYSTLSIDADGNLTRAIPYLEQGSESGFWRAQLAMADVHNHGLGRPRNCTAAVMVLKKMVETHSGVANELRDGVALYQKGDVMEARQIFCELAEQARQIFCELAEQGFWN